MFRANDYDQWYVGKIALRGYKCLEQMTMITSMTMITRMNMITGMWEMKNTRD